MFVRILHVGAYACYPRPTLNDPPAWNFRYCNNTAFYAESAVKHQPTNFRYCKVAHGDNISLALRTVGTGIVGIVGLVLGTQTTLVGLILGTQTALVGLILGTQTTLVGLVLGTQTTLVGLIVGTQTALVGLILGTQTTL